MLNAFSVLQLSIREIATEHTAGFRPVVKKWPGQNTNCCILQSSPETWSISDGYLTSNVSFVTQEQLGRILWSVLWRRSDYHLNNPSSLNFQLFCTQVDMGGIYHVSILSEKKGKIIRIDSRHFVKNESTQPFGIGKRPHLYQENLNCISATTKYSFPSRWKFPPFLLEHRLLTVIFPLFLLTPFQYSTAVLILFCLSDKDIVVTKYYANCFCLVLKICCTALF